MAGKMEKPATSTYSEPSYLTSQDEKQNALKQKFYRADVSEMIVPEI